MTVVSLELLPRREPGGGTDEAGQHGDEGRASCGGEPAVQDEQPADKSKIIDEFAASTGYHPKHVMRVLPAGPSGRRSAPRLSRRIYGAAEPEALIVLWRLPIALAGSGLRRLTVNGVP
jgi:hypothetical protein